MFDRVHLQILRVYHLSIGLQSQCYAWHIPVGAWSTLPQPGQSSRKNCPKEDKNNSEYQLKHLKYVDSDMKKMISMNKNPLTMFVFNGKLHETIITKFFPEIVRIYAASTPSVNGVDQTWQLNIPNGGFNLFFHGESSIHCYFHVRVGFHSWRRKFHPKICCDGIWMYCHGTI
jgi:hypothetical protein